MDEFLLKAYNFFSKEMTVILTAALPVIELRGAIPVGISLGLSPLHSAILSFIGSMIPVPFILYAVRPLFKYLKTVGILRRFVDRITDNSMRKHSGKIKKYGIWGLVLLVAIPLPGTGVWTGSLVAALLDIRFKRAFPAIFAGNLIAGFLVMMLSKGIIKIF